MQDQNLIRLDDFMLRGAKFGCIAVALGIILAVAWPEGASISAGTVFAGVTFASVAPLTMLVLGLELRRRERRAVALMGLMDRQVEISADDLLANSDFTGATLATAIRDLNSSGVRHVVWDRKSNLLQDGWLRQSRVHVETCAFCGTKISVDIALYEAAAARCPSCDVPLDAREIDEQKQAMMTEISERSRPRPVRVKEGWQFSLPIFLVLLVFCWPLALVYAVKCWRPITCCDPGVSSCEPSGTPPSA